MKTHRHSQPRERRTLARTSCALPVVYRAGSSKPHDAVIVEVGHGGIRLRTQRALVPGHFAMIYAQPAKAGRIELKTRTVWSHFDASQRAFISGLRVLHDVPDTGARLAELVYDALEQNGATAPLFDESLAMPLAWSA